MQRIPFTDREEGTLRSASLWMRFIAIFQLVVGAAGLVLITIFGFMSTAILTYLENAPNVSFAFDFSVPLFSAVVAGLVIAIIAGMWASVSLLRAGDRFRQVADTDTDDSTLLAEGLSALATFFLVEAVASVFGASAAILGAVIPAVMS